MLEVLSSVAEQSGQVIEHNFWENQIIINFSTFFRHLMSCCRLKRLE